MAAGIRYRHEFKQALLLAQLRPGRWCPLPRVYRSRTRAAESARRLRRKGLEGYEFRGFDFIANGVHEGRVYVRTVGG
jgi:hypothetical protein